MRLVRWSIMKARRYLQTTAVPRFRGESRDWKPQTERRYAGASGAGHGHRLRSIRSGHSPAAAPARAHASIAHCAGSSRKASEKIESIATTNPDRPTDLTGYRQNRALDYGVEERRTQPVGAGKDSASVTVRSARPSRSTPVSTVVSERTTKPPVTGAPPVSDVIAPAGPAVGRGGHCSETPPRAHRSTQRWPVLQQGKFWAGGTSGAKSNESKNSRSSGTPAVRNSLRAERTAALGSAGQLASTDRTCDRVSGSSMGQ